MPWPRFQHLHPSLWSGPPERSESIEPEAFSALREAAIGLADHFPTLTIGWHNDDERGPLAERRRLAAHLPQLGDRLRQARFHRTGPCIVVQGERFELELRRAGAASPAGEFFPAWGVELVEPRFWPELSVAAAVALIGTLNG